MSNKKLSIVLIKYICLFLKTKNFCKFRLICKKNNKLFFEILKDLKLVGNIDDPCFLTKFKNITSLEIGEVKIGNINIIIPDIIKNIVVSYGNISKFKFPKNIINLHINNKFNKKNYYEYDFNIMGVKNIDILHLKKIEGITSASFYRKFIDLSNIRYLKIPEFFIDTMKFYSEYIECYNCNLISFPLKFLKCCTYVSNFNLPIEAIDIGGIYYKINKVDLTNVENIIFRNISEFPKVNYYFKDKNKITFIDCSNEFIEFLDC